jgi:hypothetical protein
VETSRWTEGIFITIGTCEISLHNVCEEVPPQQRPGPLGQWMRGPEGRPPNVSPARQGWEINPQEDPSAVGAALNTSGLYTCAACMDANAWRAASTVKSMSAVVCSVPRNAASNWEGGSHTPRSSIAR